MADETRNYTPEDAIEQGRADAQANAKAQSDGQPEQQADRTLDAIAEGKEQAELNYDAEQSVQPERVSPELTNDTSKAAKVRFTKDQLDPAGDDPITKGEIEKAATNADMSTGNKTAVSNAEAAKRAANPGEAEEASPANLENRTAVAEGKTSDAEADKTS